MALLKKSLLIFALSSISIFPALLAQNVGIGESNPGAKLSVKGHLSVGSGYSGTYIPPDNGVIIEGQTVVGRGGPLFTSDVLTSYSHGAKYGVCGYVYTGQPITVEAGISGINSTALFGRIEGAGGVGLLVEHYSAQDYGAVINTYGANSVTALKGDSESTRAHGLMGENPANGLGYAVYCNGDIYIANGVYGPSDAQLKQNIQTYNKGLMTIMALNPKSYIYKPELAEKFRFPQTEQIGFLAQELETVMPNLVREGRLVSAATSSREEDKTVAEEVLMAKTVNYTALIPVLTSAIQEQQAQIEQQGALIAKQAEILEKLEAQNKLMQQQIEILMQKAQ